MLPNMFKIAGELTPAVIHVAARTRRHARAVDLRRPQRRDGAPARPAGRCSPPSSVQEAHDFALVAHAATLRVAGAVPALLRRLPHQPRDRTRSSCSTTTTCARSFDDDDVLGAPRCAGLTPDAPDAPRHRAEPRRLLPGPRGGQPVLRRRARHRRRACSTSSPQRTGRRYRLVDYDGAPDAERVVVHDGLGRRRRRGDGRGARAPRGERVGVLDGPPVPAVPGRGASRGAARDRRARSPCSTAPRSRARSASRCTSTSSPRCTRRWRRRAAARAPAA